MARQPNGRAAIYLGADGWYHTYVTVGHKAGGKLDRRHIRGKTQAAVMDKLDQLLTSLKRGHVPEVGASPTVAEWLEHWLTVIAPRKVRASTLQGYESKVRHRIIPAIGHVRLAKLTPEQVEAFYGRLEREVAPATALQIHRILSRAMRVAMQRGKIGRNPCSRDLIEPPSHTRDEVEPLSAADTRRVLDAAARTVMMARWVLALALGLRQGEVLGLRWDHVDLDGPVPTVTIRWALARLKWRHGCDGCGKRAASCPQRHGGGLQLVEVKSRRSRRTLPLSPGLVRILREHRQAQRKARLASRHWVDTGHVFTDAYGKPVDPRRDWGAWKVLLESAGVRDAKVHDARHTAATTMRALGWDLREIMEWLGHSQISVTTIYTHVPDDVMRERASQLDSALLLQPDSATTRGV